MTEKDKSFQKLEERTLVVRNFDPDLTTKELLEELFSNFGPINNVVLKRDFAFIGYTEPESVAYALAMMHGICLHGRRLSLLPKLSSRSYYYRYLDSLETFERECDKNKKFLDQFQSSKQHEERQTIVRQFKNSKKDREKILTRLRHYRRHYDSDSNYNPYFGRDLVDDRHRYGNRHHDRYDEYPEQYPPTIPPPSMQPYPRSGLSNDHHYNDNVIVPPVVAPPQPPMYDSHPSRYEHPPYLPPPQYGHQYTDPPLPPQSVHAPPPGPYYNDRIATCPPGPPVPFVDYGYHSYDGPPRHHSTRENFHRGMGRYHR
ncbi:uncharacterized protein LOC113798529 [Dermatophagoides pteronyssinus]|uniref:uncharacterized protein LOC113798529 n=1 Tax=Dermatophagoides pteronyssinus TaxID=6956 RepID=UPI003F671B87